jgi:hypothetical protein
VSRCCHIHSPLFRDNVYDADDDVTSFALTNDDIDVSSCSGDLVMSDTVCWMKSSDAVCADCCICRIEFEFPGVYASGARRLRASRAKAERSSHTVS